MDLRFTKLLKRWEYGLAGNQIVMGFWGLFFSIVILAVLGVSAVRAHQRVDECAQIRRECIEARLLGCIADYDESSASIGDFYIYLDCECETHECPGEAGSPEDLLLARGSMKSEGLANANGCRVNSSLPGNRSS